MGIGPPAVTRRPVLRQPRVGSLLSTARDSTLDDTDGRWQNGYSYRHGGCGANTDVRDPCESAAFTGTADTDIVGPVEPFVVSAKEECSTFGWGQAEYEERAVQLFDACKSDRIAQELWRGDQARASNWADNPFLTSLDSDVITAGAVSASQALAVLEHALRHSCTCGQPVLIHAPATVFTLWAQEQLVYEQNGLLRTHLGTLIVVDSGYDGSGPIDDTFPEGEPTPAADGNVWVYGTDQVSYKVDSPRVTPGTLSEAQNLAGAVNPSSNDVTVYAEGMAAVDFPGCCHFAVQVDAPMPDVAGAGS